MITSQFYFQKSKHFLLPLLDLGNDIIPKNSYLYWDKSDGIENFQIILLFEKNKLIEKRLLESPRLKECFSNKLWDIYVFDLIEWSKDVMYFLDGKYSKFSEKAKTKILQFYNFKIIPKEKYTKDKKVQWTTHIAFYPQYYYEDAAEELGMSVQYLKSCGELWSIFDKDKETLHCEIENQYSYNDNQLTLKKGN